MGVTSEHGKQPPDRATLVGRALHQGAYFLAASLLWSTVGCNWDQFYLFTPPPAPPPPQESLTIRGDRFESERTPLTEKDANAIARLGGAQDLYRLGNFKDAEKIFHYIADNTKVGPQIAEEARFYEAECLRHQQKYPKASDTYNKMLTDFPSGAFREQAIMHMYEIANYWLEDTRREMAEREEKAEGKRTVVWPEYVHLETAKPFMDEEGRALEKLEQVRYNDMTGPLADKSLFLAGRVKLYRKDYKEAEHYFSQLVEMHKNSPFAPQALELAIICKQLATGGPDYDGRKLVEARKLVDVALRSYPELASTKSDFLERQIGSITLQQAAKDFNTAEFYRRTGHPCSAYFCYQVVRMRYPGTKYFDMATERMRELHDKLEKQKKGAAGDVPSPEQRAASAGAPTAPDVPAAAMPGRLPANLGDR